MRALRTMCVAAVLSCPLMPSAHALCIYHGKMYAKTTVAQEFADSRWVVRVRVIAADDHWSDKEDSWSLYHLQVLTSFKGNPPARIAMFTYRDSGGFFLDKGLANDLGGEYLLFLDSVSHQDTAPGIAKDATEVNYSCGQSKSWNAVSTSERQELEKLAQHTQK